MVKKNKIVIDSNIFVNALFGGLSKRIFEQIDSGESELVISEDIFAEYSALVEYPEIKNNIDSLNRKRSLIYVETKKTTNF